MYTKGVASPSVRSCSNLSSAKVEHIPAAAAVPAGSLPALTRAPLCLLEDPGRPEAICGDDMHSTADRAHTLTWRLLTYVIENGCLLVHVAPLILNGILQLHDLQQRDSSAASSLTWARWCSKCRLSRRWPSELLQELQHGSFRSRLHAQMKMQANLAQVRDRTGIIVIGHDGFCARSRPSLSITRSSSSAACWELSKSCILLSKAASSVCTSALRTVSCVSPYV